MVSCEYCSFYYKECRLSSLSKSCAECVRRKKKCKPYEPVVDFSGIDKAMSKLEQEELKAEALWEAANNAARVQQELAEAQ